MEPSVIFFYGAGAGLAIAGLISACFEGFTANEWWMLGVGAVLAIVGLFIQLGWLNPPSKE